MPWSELLSLRERLDDAPLAEWYEALLARAGQQPLRLALLGGRLASTPGRAFLAGYQAALRALWPAAPPSLGALCVTEQRSVRPADMQTRLDGLVLTGNKDFVTAAEAADWLLVAAREVPAGAAPQIALAVLYAGTPGVVLQGLPGMPLLADIPHARLRLQQAQCERLPGDGWAEYCKPFRSLEDLYVLCALHAWLLGVAQQCAWPQALQLRVLSLLAGCAEVARQPASDAAGHLLLAGLFAQQEALSADIDAAFASSPTAWQQLWQRDRAVLGLAAKARARRLDVAVQRLGL